MVQKIITNCLLTDVILQYDHIAIYHPEQPVDYEMLAHKMKPDQEILIYSYHYSATVYFERKSVKKRFFYQIISFFKGITTTHCNKLLYK